MNLFTLMGSIMIDNGKANDSIDKTSEKTDGMGKKLLDVAGKAVKFTAGVGGAVLDVGKKMFGMAEESAGATDRIDKMSQKIGMSRQAFQEFDYICSQNGMSVESLQGGYKTLTASMDKAGSGNKEATAMFKQLGVAVKDSTGKLRSQEDVFNDSVKAIQNMADGTEKARMAQTLFGKAGAEMMPMLNGSAEGMEKLKNRAHHLGLVLSDEAIDSGVAFTDQMDELKRSFGSITTQLGVAFMPILQSLMSWVQNHLPEIQAFFKVAFDVIGNVVDWVGTAIVWLQEKFDLVFPKIKDIVSKTFEGIKGFWESSLKPLFNAIGDLIQYVLLPIFIQVFSRIQGVFEGLFANAKNIFGSIKTIFMGIIDFLVGVFTGDWKRAWDGVVGIFKGIWQGFVAILKAPLNLGIGMINGLIKGLNRIKLPDWLGGKGISIPEIPYLAKGTQNFQGGMAVVGEGTLQGELVNLPRGSTVTPAGKTNQSNKPIVCNIFMDGRVLAQGIAEYNGEEQYNFNMRFGGAY